jgi:hypothetical protein
MSVNKLIVYYLIIAYGLVLILSSPSVYKYPTEIKETSLIHKPPPARFGPGISQQRADMPRPFSLRIATLEDSRTNDQSMDNNGYHTFLQDSFN